MIKKHILGALALSMLIPLGVSAQTLTTKSDTKAATTTTQKDSAKAPYASQIKLEKQTIKTNNETNQTIKTAIKGKLVQVKTLIAQDKPNKTLKAKKDALKAQRALIKADKTALKGIDVKLVADKKIAKTDVTNKNYAALVSDLNNIASLQTSKTPILQKLSSDLDTLISSLSK
ncbi:hypothetical protein [Clostridium estertheticum]|uniref:Uncharacterized protein n=1 Tax=Clostridium estertheticum TaxID=238834 RepID=A0AA47EM58_9CLOT|nr:hypothetical protein [Clostridium estertheticum]MBU3156878.1 hypothetical protein [Clostridium estertheticum]WAG62640.1 hypothetical protein LL038_10560 [Clostridium estertheticum]